MFCSVRSLLPLFSTKKIHWQDVAHDTFQLTRSTALNKPSYIITYIYKYLKLLTFMVELTLNVEFVKRCLIVKYIYVTILARLYLRLSD